VPFCPSICPYCDFHVLERRGDLVERYLTRLEQDAETLAGQYDIQLDTLYLGGGTPSFLRGGEMEVLVASLRRHLGWGMSDMSSEIELSASGTQEPSPVGHGIREGEPAENRAQGERGRLDASAVQR